MKNLRIQHKLFIKIKDLNYRKKYRFFIISTCFHWRFCFYLLMTNISLKLYSVRLHVQMNLKPLLKITTCGRAHNRGITWTLRCFLDMTFPLFWDFHYHKSQRLGLKNPKKLFFSVIKSFEVSHRIYFVAVNFWIIEVIY